MIYLDNGATTLHKPASVIRAVAGAISRCANPGRGGYSAAMAAADAVYRCRETAAEMFDCQPEQVAFTSNCTHGLNIAISTLVQPGDGVVISGFEHNAVVRPLHALGAKVTVAGRKLFDWDDMLFGFEKAIKKGAKIAIFTHVSNVFGYILPVEQLSRMCRENGVRFIVDAAQSAGSLPVSLTDWGADFIAMPGHKGLLGPQGTGILLCGAQPRPLLYGGTGSASRDPDMPDFLPDRVEAGTLNVPGIAGLNAGMTFLRQIGISNVLRWEQNQAKRCADGLKNMGYTVFAGSHQGGTVSFLPKIDCEEAAEKLAKQGIAVRAGLHCAPLAHESAGTLETGTVRISFGHVASDTQTQMLLKAAAHL